MNGFGFDSTFSAIVVTGGPCAGKSTFMAIARQYLEDRGFRVVIQPEVATEFISSGFSPVSGWRDPILFQMQLFEYMLHREQMYYGMLQLQVPERPRVLLCDRGVLDAIAYIGAESFDNMISSLGYERSELLHRYKAVLHLVTAADGAEKFYTLVNNAARSESPDVARALDTRTRDAWVGHPHLFTVDNSTGFDEKITRALKHLTRVLGMPLPLERERKFLVTEWDLATLPTNAVAIDITQVYLTPGPNGEERRVRIRKLNGVSSFYYTVKTDTGVVGERHEEEHQITMERCDELLKEKDPKTKIIRKKRYCIPYANRMIELDVYGRLARSIVIAEVEVSDLNDQVSFPPTWKVEEVTGVEKYKNRRIAEGSLS